VPRRRSGSRSFSVRPPAAYVLAWVRLKFMKRKTPGFSLIELMIVIVIISVLAAVAVPIYARYIRKSRTSEAVSNLGTIAMFEETYYSEADSYITAGPNPVNVPNPSLPTGRLPFNGTITGWNLLGRVIPDGQQLYFQYEARAGQFDAVGSPNTSNYLVKNTDPAKPGGNDCNNTTNLTALSLGIPTNPSSSWFYITAVGDQKGGSGSRGQKFCSLFIKVIDRSDISVQNDID
jgi:prepilin-type N-terminal cleavage/methylation domain-containing protein